MKKESETNFSATNLCFILFNLISRASILSFSLGMDFLSFRKECFQFIFSSNKMEASGERHLEIRVFFSDLVYNKPLADPGFSRGGANLRKR